MLGVVPALYYSVITTHHVFYTVPMPGGSRPRRRPHEAPHAGFSLQIVNVTAELCGRGRKSPEGQRRAPGDSCWM
ncbi:hypothetical protein EYF80_051708 [Liparis tanakae]|uniref:Uncharacterized protein n=1 Tax=Liparis tanakae TaxID=230148 RepID=A0A4Z2FAB0_9TELE|nr:hypothetical protein EYF80_051708 [Liparis tanakae]